MTTNTKPHSALSTPAADPSRKIVEVVAAIILDGGRVFATQRGYGDFKDMWEFPGGKMEPGEGPEEALVREIREELATDIAVDSLVGTVEHDYPTFHLTMHCYLCHIVSGNLELIEHEAARWLDLKHLYNVEWLPADLKILEPLRASLSSPAHAGAGMVRIACREDIPLIGAMADIAFRDAYKDILTPEQTEYMMEMMYSEDSLARQMTVRGDVFFLIDGKGYASVRPDGLSPDGRSVYHLEKLYVLPAFQGLGLGKLLFESIVHYIVAQCDNAPVLELNVNRHNPAVTFYEHMGMHRDRQGDFPIGRGFYMNDYIMAMDLSQI